MGNKKNIYRHHQNCRHVYMKRKVKTPNTLPLEKTPPIKAPDGSRIINLQKLAEFINIMSEHLLSCDEARAAVLENKPAVTIEGESKMGLASILGIKCSGCNKIMSLRSANKVKCAKGSRKWECNIAAVWGQMATGGGHNKLKETLSILGVPSMSQKSFIETERDIGEWWKNQLEESMKEAGREERTLAIENRLP